MSVANLKPPSDRMSRATWATRKARALRRPDSRALAAARSAGESKCCGCPFRRAGAAREAFRLGRRLRLRQTRSSSSTVTYLRSSTYAKYMKVYASLGRCPGARGGEATLSPHSSHVERGAAFGAVVRTNQSSIDRPRDSIHVIGEPHAQRATPRHKPPANLKHPPPSPFATTSKS